MFKTLAVPTSSLEMNNRLPSGLTANCSGSEPAGNFPTTFRVFAGMAGAHGLGHVVLRDGWLLPMAAALAMLGPTSTDIALGRLRPTPWLAIPAGAMLAFLIFLAGGRLHDTFIYFQF